MAYSDKKRKFTESTKGNKVVTSIPISILMNLFIYATSTSEHISKSNLKNLKDLLDSIDLEKSYDSENELPTIQFFKVLHATVECMLDELVDDTDELEEYLVNKFSEEEVPESTINSMIEKMLNCEELSKKRIQHWNKYIESTLDHISIYQNIPELEEIVESFKHTDPKKIDYIVPRAKEILTILCQQFSRHTMSTDSKRNSFNPLDKSSARMVIGNSLNSILNPGNKITTGIQMLDEMLGGGMQQERVYLLLGQSKGFKSGTVLNIVLNVATKYKSYQLKDNSKIPCVLYFTMENSMNETFERIYNYLGLEFNFDYEIITNKMGEEVKKYKIGEEEIDEILGIIQRETYEKTGIVLRIEFKEHMSVDTGVLEKFYDDYNNLDNQEIIFIAQDYIKRIHSQRIYKSEQKREELGEVINEFANFAKQKKIPILTISQLNRAALTTTETAKKKRKKDVIRGVGASYVGESNLVYENADYTILTNREVNDEDDRIYQTFSLAMARSKSYRDYFAQPFDPNPKYKGFKIAVDIDLPKPLGKERISSFADANDINEKENSVESIKNRRKKKLNAGSINIEEGEEIDVDLEDLSEEIDTENELE